MYADFFDDDGAYYSQARDLKRSRIKPQPLHRGPWPSAGADEDDDEGESADELNETLEREGFVTGGEGDDQDEFEGFGQDGQWIAAREPRLLR